MYQCVYLYYFIYSLVVKIQFFQVYTEFVHSSPLQRSAGEESDVARFQITSVAAISGQLATSAANTSNSMYYILIRFPWPWREKHYLITWLWRTHSVYKYTNANYEVCNYVSTYWKIVHAQCTLVWRIISYILYT